VLRDRLWGLLRDQPVGLVVQGRDQPVDTIFLQQAAETASQGLSPSGRGTRPARAGRIPRPLGLGLINARSRRGT